MTRPWGVVVVLLAAQAAPAAEEAHGSVVGARTAAEQQNVIEVGVGLPSVASASFRHGLTSFLELGARASFTLGLEGQVLFGWVGTSLPYAPGFKVQGLLKAKLFDSGALSLGLSFEPGFFLIVVTTVYPGSPTSALPGLSLPVELKLGLATSAATTVGFTLGAPVWAVPAMQAFSVPVLAGVGVEHAVTPSLLLFGRLRAGPNLPVLRLIVDAQVGLAWRL